jgi:DNA-binding CsgD family transcriptional regulator
VAIRQTSSSLLIPVDDIRARLRTLAPGDIDAWLEECDVHIREAQRNDDAALVVELAILAASGLDAAGRFDDALERVEFGLRSATTPSHRAKLWLFRAVACVIAGDIEEARRSLSRADGVTDENPGARDRLEYAAYHSVVASIALEEPSVEAAHAAIAEAQAAGFDWLASGMVVWLVPWLAARGLAMAAMPWVDWLQALSEMVAHRYRAEDAAALKFAIAMTRQTGATALAAPTVTNSTATWRVLKVQLRQALLQGRHERALELVTALEERASAMNPGFRDGSGGFRALVQATAGVELDGVQEPKAVTLVTLPAWLAGAEAAAIGGARSEATRWRRLIAESLPAWVTTSLGWSASLQRIRALLALRDGDVRGADALFRAAAAETERAQAAIEHAITVIQWQELAAAGVAAPDRRGYSVSGARELLARVGVPAAPQAYAAARALAAVTVDTSGPRLTAREIQVLSGLGAGRTYRQMGEELGIGWRTVQTHAYHLYRKLNVSGRDDALAVARAQRLL